MFTSRFRPLALLVVVLAAGCHSAPAELSATDIAAIRQTSDRWLSAVRAGQWGDAAATYTENAIRRASRSSRRC
jgi:hypothetical protein